MLQCYKDQITHQHTAEIQPAPLSETPSVKLLNDHMPITCNTAHMESKQWVNLPQLGSLHRIKPRPLTADQLQLCPPGTHSSSIRLLGFTSNHLQPWSIPSSFPTPTSAGQNLHQKKKGVGRGRRHTDFSRKSLRMCNLLSSGRINKISLPQICMVKESKSMKHNANI